MGSFSGSPRFSIKTLVSCSPFMLVFALTVFSYSLFAVDIGIFNPQNNEFEVRLRPSQDLQGSITNIQFTVKWPENTTQLSNITSDFLVQQQGPVFQDEGFNYAVFVAVPGDDDIQIDWQAGTEQVILAFETAPDEAVLECYFIADDEWADINNGLYYFEMSDAPYTGNIYSPFSGFCNAINIGLFNPECSRFEVRLKPAIDFESNITNIQFTLKWPENSVEFIDFHSDYKLQQQGPVFSHDGFNYAVFVSVAETSAGIPIDWQAGEAYVVLTFLHDQSGEGFADILIADDQWADDNNGLPFVELLGADYTGFIYQQALGSFIGACNFVYTRVILQGAWLENEQLMRTTINAAGNLPLEQPYNGEPWNYPGTEAVTQFPDSIVDWVLVELRDPVEPATIVETRAGLLTKNGLVLNVDFEDGIAFASDPGDYYLVVKHRNHIPVMSGMPVSFPNNLEPYNFIEIELTQPYKHLDPLATVIELEPRPSGKYGMIAGNVMANDQLRYTGDDNDRLPILNLINAFHSSSSIFTTVPGYHNEDVNLDNEVKYTGDLNDRIIILNNIQELTPATFSIFGIYESVVP